VAEQASGPALVLTEEEALEIITFLVSSAEICLHEPIYYGTFRLVDGASRLMGAMLEHDPPQTGDFLRSFKAEIDAKKTSMMWDREAYFEFLRAIPALAAAELKRLRDAGGTGGSAS
jgi:hypothetical protein